MYRKDNTTDSMAHWMTSVPEMGESRRLPPKISRLRQKLYQKAKQEPQFRFYALYDRIYRKDVLTAAWEIVARNKGAAGVDGETIDQIVEREGGPGRLVDELHEELRKKSYRPRGIKRMYIPKPDGRERPLGIPCVRDRVVETAVVLVIEPIFEADFEDCSYGFRPKRSAHQALGEVRKHIKAGLTEIYDADLQGYFDTIPHEKLMSALEVRIADRSVLKLIRMWLKSPVQDKRDGGKPRRSNRGTPQGGVISPLLSNLYLHWFDREFHRSSGPSKFAQAKLVRFADDFVVLAKYQGKRLQDWIEYIVEGRLDLTINRRKTRIVKIKEQGEHFDFLGYTFRLDRDLHGRDRRYLNVFPSKKSVMNEKQKLREKTCPARSFVPIPSLIEELNRHLKGWSNYFSYGYPRKELRGINSYVRLRLTRHLRRRSQRPFRPPKGVTYYQQFEKMNLIYL